MYCRPNPKQQELGRKLALSFLAARAKEETPGHRKWSPDSSWLSAPVKGRGLFLGPCKGYTVQRSLQGPKSSVWGVF